MSDQLFRANYLLEPPPPLPPGTYCRNCGHTDPMYYDRLVPRRRGEDVPCCSRKECGCTAHLVETFIVKLRMVVRFRCDETFPLLKIAYVRGVCACPQRWQWECTRALSVDDLRMARDCGQLRELWREVRGAMAREIENLTSTCFATHGRSTR